MSTLDGPQEKEEQQEEKRGETCMRVILRFCCVMVTVFSSSLFLSTCHQSREWSKKVRAEQKAGWAGTRAGARAGLRTG